MFEIRAAALTLIAMASGLTDKPDLMFCVGGGALLEAIKASDTSRDYGPDDVPDCDLTTEKRLVGMPLKFDPLMPGDGLAAIVGGRVIAGLMVNVTPGCMSAGARLAQLPGGADGSASL